MHSASAGSGFLLLSAPMDEWQPPPRQTLLVRLRGGEVAVAEPRGGGKLKSIFFFCRRVRSGACGVRPGLPGGAGPAGSFPRSSSGNQTSAIRVGLHSDMQQSFSLQLNELWRSQCSRDRELTSSILNRGPWNHDSHNALALSLGSLAASEGENVRGKFPFSQFARAALLLCIVRTLSGLYMAEGGSERRLGPVHCAGWFPITYHLELEGQREVAAASAPSSPSTGSADTVSPASFPLGQPKTKRKKEKGEGGKRNRCVEVYLQLNGLCRGRGGCESIRREPRFLPRGPASLFPRLPSSPVFIWAKYVHAKVNSLLATHKLRMTCLAAFLMESAVFQSSLPFAKFSGGRRPA